MKDGLSGNALSTAWLGARLGIGGTRVEMMRRAGELFGVRPPGAREYLYPAWQFGRDGKPLAVVPRLLAAAKAEGIDELRLHELLSMRVGLAGSRRLADVARDGDEEHVLRVIRSATRAAA